MRYILSRFGFYTVAAWIAMTVNFAIPRLMPGDPASTMFARFKGKLEPEAMASLQETLGFASDAGLLKQYWDYLVHTCQGEFGTSIAYFPAPVGEIVQGGLAWTLGLTGLTVIISFAVGTLLGVLAAWRRTGWLDSFVPPVLALLGAFPYFWLAMAVLYIFGFTLAWFPLGRAYGADAVPGFNWLFLSDLVRHGFLPAITIIVCTLGGWMLSMRNTMISVLGSDYIAVARAKGLAPRRVMLHYAARNALLPNVTGFGMALGFVLSGSLLTEMVFSYPGQGYLLIEAVRQQDYPLMQGLFLIITLAVLGANFFVDLVYLWLDPRTRA